MPSTGTRDHGKRHVSRVWLSAGSRTQHTPAVAPGKMCSAKKEHSIYWWCVKDSTRHWLLTAWAKDTLLVYFWSLFLVFRPEYLFLVFGPQYLWRGLSPTPLPRPSFYLGRNLAHTLSISTQPVCLPRLAAAAGPCRRRLPPCRHHQRSPLIVTKGSIPTSPSPHASLRCIRPAFLVASRTKFVVLL